MFIFLCESEHALACAFVLSALEISNIRVRFTLNDGIFSHLPFIWAHCYNALWQHKPLFSMHVLR